MEKIDHIAIAVHSIEEALPFYQETLGLSLDRIEEVPSQKVRVAFVQIGDSKIELLEPTSPDSPISRFLETRGPGIHHLALETGSLAERLQSMGDQGVRLIDKSPKPGAHGKQIAFVHPKATGGVLLELCADGEKS